MAACNSSSSSELMASSSLPSSEPRFELADFRCSITLETPSDPATTDCGHIFEYTAILNWQFHHDSCPICKEPLFRGNITRSPFLARILRPFVAPRLAAEKLAFLMDDYEAVPELIDLPLVATPVLTTLRTPEPDLPTFRWPLIDFVRSSENNGFLTTIHQTQPRHEILGHGNLINFHSSNFATLTNNVYVSNATFYAHCVQPDQTSDLYKYMYRHRGSVTSAMIAAAHHGYFVYDMFYHSPNRYVLMSLSFRRDMGSHSLDLLV